MIELTADWCYVCQHVESFLEQTMLERKWGRTDLAGFNRILLLGPARVRPVPSEMKHMISRNLDRILTGF